MGTSETKRLDVGQTVFLAYIDQDDSTAFVARGEVISLDAIPETDVAPAHVELRCNFDMTENKMGMMQARGRSVDDLLDAGEIFFCPEAAWAEVERRASVKAALWCAAAQRVREMSAEQLAAPGTFDAHDALESLIGEPDSVKRAMFEALVLAAEG